MTAPSTSLASLLRYRLEFSLRPLLQHSFEISLVCAMTIFTSSMRTIALDMLFQLFDDGKIFVHSDDDLRVAVNGVAGLCSDRNAASS